MRTLHNEGLWEQLGVHKTVKSPNMVTFGMTVRPDLSECILIIHCQPSFPFEFRRPVPGKFMVGAGGHFTLQPMARTNHIFPGSGRLKGSEIDSIIESVLADFRMSKFMGI